MATAAPNHLITDLVKVIDRLLSELTILNRAIINDEHLFAWTEGFLLSNGKPYQEDYLLARQQASNIYSEITKSAGGDGRLTNGLVGLLAASESTMKQAKIVNLAKDELIQTYHLIGEKSANSTRLRQNAIISSQVLEVLMPTGNPNLHIVQARRHIPYFENPQSFVGFSRAKKSVNPRLTIAEARTSLKALEQTEAVQLQLEKLQSLGLSDKTKAIAIMRGQGLSACVNSVDSQTKIRKSHWFSMPILFPAGEVEPLINIGISMQEQLLELYGNIRQERNDKKIYNEMLLPSLQGYLALD